MKTKAKYGLMLVVFASVALFLAGCDGEGGDYVYVEDGYAPAIVQNVSYDDVIIESAMFGSIYLAPGSTVELAVGPNADHVVAFVNGLYFDEFYLYSGDVIIFQ